MVATPPRPRLVLTQQMRDDAGWFRPLQAGITGNGLSLDYLICN
jgi:hypothetical protein